MSETKRNLKKNVMVILLPIIIKPDILILWFKYILKIKCLSCAGLSKFQITLRSALYTAESPVIYHVTFERSC